MLGTQFAFQFLMGKQAANSVSREIGQKRENMTTRRKYAENGVLGGQVEPSGETKQCLNKLQFNYE